MKMKSISSMQKVATLSMVFMRTTSCRCRAGMKRTSFRTRMSRKVRSTESPPPCCPTISHTLRGKEFVVGWAENTWHEGRGRRSKGEGGIRREERWGAGDPPWAERSSQRLLGLNPGSAALSCNHSSVRAQKQLFNWHSLCHLGPRLSQDT